MRSERWTTRARVGLVNSHPNAVAKSNSCPLKGVCIFDGARERNDRTCRLISVSYLINVNRSPITSRNRTETDVVVALAKIRERDSSKATGKDNRRNNESAKKKAGA
jgi:hypothetical protein